MKSDFKVYLSAYHNEVTGSRLMLVIERPDGIVYRILVDDGYFQEIQYRYLNYVDDLNPEDIDAILITHNHIDHTGLVPKTVRQGYRKKIYMTDITRELVRDFWKDSAEQQEDNARDLRERYPDEAFKFKPLYFSEDVDNAIDLCVGIKYRKTIEILPGVKVTFFENGHLLGAAMILVQCLYENRKSINFFFTGDYKLTNTFYSVPQLPSWVRKMELIMINESTYGTTKESDIKICFERNISEAFKRKQNILIGAFAQGRMQEVLYRIKVMQDKNYIPEEYEICVDGPLGIKTCFKYQEILETFNPAMKDFMPKGIVFVDPKSRSNILDDGRPKLVITTSGMLSNGPARVYVPIFLEHPNALIHLIGYAAEETLARKLLEAKRSETVTIGNKVYQKRAVVKTTREATSHATEDQMIRFINQFDNIQLLVINHGEKSVRESFAEDVSKECKKVRNVALIDRDHMFCIYQFGYENDEYSNLVIKKLPAKLNNYQLLFGKETEKKSKKKSKKRKQPKKRQKQNYKNRKHSR